MWCYICLSFVDRYYLRITQSVSRPHIFNNEVYDERISHLSELRGISFVSTAKLLLRRDGICAHTCELTVSSSDVENTMNEYTGISNSVWKIEFWLICKHVYWFKNKLFLVLGGISPHSSESFLIVRSFQSQKFPLLDFLQLNNIQTMPIETPLINENDWRKPAWLKTVLTQSGLLRKPFSWLVNVYLCTVDEILMRKSSFR